MVERFFADTSVASHSFFTIDPDWALANDPLTLCPLSPKGERGVR
jgi:hypothetical protein